MPSAKKKEGPSSLDRAFQGVYWLGYRVMRVWWKVARPQTHGAFVGLWCDGRVLVLQNSYAPYRSFPGGGIQRGEEPLAAAVRECREEVGINVRASDLTFEGKTEHLWEGKRDTVWLYSLELPFEPEVIIDHREVSEARFVDPAEVLQGRLFLPVREHLEQRLRSGETRPSASSDGA